MAGKRESMRERARAALRAFRQDPQSVGYRLRLNLVDILADRMDEQGISQAELAEAADCLPSFVSRVMNAESNCTLETAGRLLFALGVRAGDVELRAVVPKRGEATGDRGACVEAGTETRLSVGSSSAAADELVLLGT